MGNPECNTCGKQMQDTADNSPVEGTKMVKCNSKGCQCEVRVPSN